jgi:hypothetical protein
MKISFNSFKQITTLLLLVILQSSVFGQKQEAKLDARKFSDDYVCISEGRLVTYVLQKESKSVDINIVDDGFAVEKTLNFQLDKRYFPKKVGATYILPKFYVEGNHAVLHVRKSGQKRGEYITLVVNLENYKMTSFENDDNDQKFSGLKVMSPSYTHAFSRETFAIVGDKLVLNKYEGSKSKLFVSSLISSSSAQKPLTLSFDSKNVFNSIYAMPETNQFMVVSLADGDVIFNCIDKNGRSVYKKTLEASSIDCNLSLSSLEFEVHGNSIVGATLCQTESFRNSGILMMRVDETGISTKEYSFSEDLKISSDEYAGSKKDEYFGAIDFTLGVTDNNVALSCQFAQRQYGSLAPNSNPMTATLTETFASIVRFTSNGMYVFDTDFNLEDQLVTEIKHNSMNRSLQRLEPLFLASNDKLSFLYCTGSSVEGYLYDGGLDYFSLYEGFNWYLSGSAIDNIVIVAAKNAKATTGDFYSGKISWMYKKLELKL